MSKIIIVEDDPMISEIYQKKFSQSVFTVLSADSGEQVIGLVQKEKADVILLDLILPRMSGFEVIKELKSGKYDGSVKIIVSSNLNQEEDQRKARELGADGFIIKSKYTPSGLVKEVERLINEFGEEEKNEKRIEREENGGGQNTNKLGQKKILLIEDEEIFLEMFGDKLKQDGFSVSCANNGAWGVKEALQGDYDLFIIDMMMPAMTGDEIVAKLKLEEKTAGKPIIILSASVDEDARKKVGDMGVNAFFVKTQIVPSELSKKASELLA
jgi:DNA-binding response OmpR family regulator